MAKRFATIRRLLITLLLAVLVVLPAVDAAVCMVEIEAPQTHGAEDDYGAEEHAVCAHGHCHHSSFYAIPVLPHVPIVHAALVAGPDGTVPESFLPDGLKRPPRV